MTKEEHVKHLLEDPVYAIMGNEELCLGRSNMDVAKELIAAGVTIIQYREKHKKWRAKYEEAKAIAQLCHDHNVTFIMNDSTAYPQLLPVCIMRCYYASCVPSFPRR